MKSRITYLIEKYWNAESSLQEEQELKQLLRKTSGFEMEKSFFGLLDEAKSVEPEALIYPQKSRSIKPNWIGWAAAITLLLSSWWVYRDYSVRQEEKAAYLEVMQALALVQGNLEKGKDQLEPLKELQHLNKPQELFDLDH